MWRKREVKRGLVGLVMVVVVVLVMVFGMDLRLQYKGSLEVGLAKCFAGDLDDSSVANASSLGTPQAYGYTLEDVYQRAVAGTEATAGGHSLDPSVNTTVPTMHTIDELYGVVKKYLPDTGQTTSYTATFGEDHDYNPAGAQPSYTDNVDGTISDNLTRLMWVKDGNSAGCNSGVTLTWEAALSFCENLTYATYSDWRLPNSRELMSIVDYGEYNPSVGKTAGTPTYFTNTKTSYYWSSTTYAYSTSYAWYVRFYVGRVGGNTKTNAYYVRPVRAGQ